MKLKDTLSICAKAAHNRRKNRYHIETGKQPDIPEQGNPLMGYCFENTREAAWELAQREIPHRIVQGAIAYDAVLNYPHWLMDHSLAEPEKSLPDNYTELVEEHANGETGAVDTSIWDEIKKPTTQKELPDEASHYWIEVDGEEVERFDSLKTFVVDTASEVRKHHGDPIVFEGHPKRFYLKTSKSYQTPWKSHDGWDFNPRNPSPY